MPKQEELEITFRKEFFRRDDFVIAGSVMNDESGLEVTIKGNAAPEQMEPGGCYRLYGRFVTYKRQHEEESQFQFSSFTPAIPNSREGVVRYLIMAGRGNGLGPATASKVWDAFGSDSIKKIRKDPGLLMQFSNRIHPQDCDEIGKVLEQQKATEAATIDLMGLLNGRGFPQKTANACIKEWGTGAAHLVRKDPYRLMKLRGCGFKLCDNLYLELGHDPARLRRQALCAWYAVASNSDGHSWMPQDYVEDAVRGAVGKQARPKQAIHLGTRLARLSPDHYGAIEQLGTTDHEGALTASLAPGALWIAEGKNARNEDRVAEAIRNKLEEAQAGSWCDVEGITAISDHQREELAKAVSTPIGILGGSPGTGKTYATARLIGHLISLGYSADSIMIGAPTGKAAVRITETMASFNVGIRAKTWHSHLGVMESKSGGWRFEHDSYNPWQQKILIGDESSMNDASLAAAILEAAPHGSRMLLVGDVNQLPPVGTGAPFRDMINSGLIGYGELREIKRNSGGIAEACAKIRDGEAWGPADNLKVIAEHSPAAQVERTISCLKQTAEHLGLDPVWDAQVLCAVNEKSPLCRKELNQVLQQVFNANDPIDNCRFRLNDKVVCLKNSSFSIVEPVGSGAFKNVDPMARKADQYVANGEQGKIIQIVLGEQKGEQPARPKSMIVQLAISGQTIRVPMGKGGAADWDLAYAISCHKSQGSEWPIVVIPIDEYGGARRVCCREWIYTAISRASKKCLLIGKKHVADSMARRVAIHQRKTFLREKLQLWSAFNTIQEL